MNILKSIILGMCLCASANAAEAAPLTQDQRQTIDKVLQSNGTVVLATITEIDGPSFSISYASGRPKGSPGPNGASSESTLYTCTATVLKVLKGEVRTSKIQFEVASRIDGEDQPVKVQSFAKGSTHVLVFRRQSEPQDDITRLDWDAPINWPKDSPEAAFILKSMDK